MSRLADAVPQPVAPIDVAAKLVSLALPARLVAPLDRARRDARVLGGALRGQRPTPVRTLTQGPTRAPHLEEIDLIDAIFPRRVAEKLQQVRRDVGTVVGVLSGDRPAPTVARRPRTTPLTTTAPTAVSTRPLRVTRVVRETPDAVSLYLEESDGKALSFVPGQFLTFELKLDGQTLRRAYSLASAALPGHAPHVTVKRVEGGRVSNHLVDHARVGDVLHALGPSGVFTVTPDSSVSRHLLLVAGGSGITPIASIAESVLATEPRSKVTLVFGNRRLDDVIFRARLMTLQARHGERFVVDHVLQDPPAEWTGARGLLDAATQRERFTTLGVDLERAEVFVCGPTPMMDAARDALSALGVDPSRVHEERFTSPEQRKPVALPKGPQPVLVTLGGTKREVVQREGQTLLDAGLAAGLAMPFSCAMGGCAACKVRLVEGDVVQEEPNCLTASERAEGYVLACCSRATGPCAVEVP
jgi:ring-1,2-phenylacetyl-CoA epoxidase subunit PaaE